MKLGYYSPHFSALEMCTSESAARNGWDNTPPLAAELELRRLCMEYLEPLRALFGPTRVTSGYRSPRLNEAIGGSSTSAHCHGRAADLQWYDPAVSLREVVAWLIQAPLPFDQVIYEYRSWVHLGIAAEGRKPRRQALMIFRGRDGYQPYNPADPRVI